MTDDTLPTLSAFDALGRLTEADAERFRFVVTPDDTADGPIQWGHLTALDLIPSGYRNGHAPTGGTDPIGLQYALDRFRDTLPDTDAVAAAAIRWAAVFHGVAVHRWQPTGANQGDWADGLLYLEDAAERAATLPEQAVTLAGWLTEADAWFAGEVYGVQLQRDIEWQPTEGGDARMHTWETVDDCDLWGCYLVGYGADTYTPADVAVENFGVTRAFADAVPVVDSWEAGR